MKDLKSEILKDVTRAVIHDPDLNLEIRDDYLNVYYKGNSLLKLAQTNHGQYRAEVHPKFSKGLSLPLVWAGPDATARFVDALPQLKRNVVASGKSSAELEYEQMIIRSNNFEPRNNSEYFIVDRQYTSVAGRSDLVGIFWNRRGRRKFQTVPLCLIEVKFALNPDISRVHDQLNRYYDALKPNAKIIADEYEIIFRQKLDLGLYNQPANRIAAMETLSFSRDISQFQIVLILVDYNPNSSKLNLARLADLPFSSQIRVFRTGFAMWQQNVKPVASPIMG